MSIEEQSLIKILRNNTEFKRPLPSILEEGQPAVNINPKEPGLYFTNRDRNQLFKIGPCHVGGSPPNSSPAVGGFVGNSIGETWLDTSNLSNPTFKVWGGTEWLTPISDFPFGGFDYNDLSNKPTLGTASPLDVASSGNASSTQIVKGNDTRLSNSREWSATTISESEARAGTSTVRRAWTSELVRKNVLAALESFTYLPSTGVTPGTYTYGNFTVDASGRISAASSGVTPVTSVGASLPLSSTGGISPTISIRPATPSVSGSMSAADKAKVDSLAAVAASGSADDLTSGTLQSARLPSTAQFSGLGLGTAPLSNWRLTTNGGTTQNVSTVTAVSGIYALDVTAGNQFITSAAIAGATTINLSNLSDIPSGYVWQGVITFQYTSGVISWFTGNSGYIVNWNGVGATAMIPTVGKIEKVVIEVVGGGSVIRVSPLGGSGTVLSSRTVSSTTPSTLNLATVDFTMSLGKVSKLLQITLSHPSWVRFYRSSSQRSADTRSGPGGTLQGVIDLGDAKPYSESVTLGLNQIIDQNPIPTLRGDADGLVYVRLVNQSGSTQSITLSTLTLRLEE